MRITRFMFKHYLLLALFVFVFCLGCKSSKKREPGENYALVNFFIEQNNDGTKYSKLVSIYPSDPELFYVNSKPFLDTADLERVTLMDATGGFALQFH